MNNPPANQNATSNTTVSAIAQPNLDADDTMRALHGDLYNALLKVYAVAKADKRKGGYDGFINSLKGRFATGPRKKNALTPPDKK